MKVTPYTVSRTPNFKADIASQNNPEKKKFKIDSKDIVGWGLCCGLAAFKGVECAKPNFKNLGIRGKIGSVIGGTLITLLLGSGLFAILKLFEKLGNKEP